MAEKPRGRGRGRGRRTADASTDEAAAIGGGLIFLLIGLYIFQNFILASEELASVTQSTMKSEIENIDRSTVASIRGDDEVDCCL